MKHRIVKYLTGQMKKSVTYSIARTEGVCKMEACKLYEAIGQLYAENRKLKETEEMWYKRYIEEEKKVKELKAELYQFRTPVAPASAEE